MKDRFDIIVVGAGPAGSVAAYAASRRGADVLLVDKASFPRYKVCGCCINAKALAVLDRLGLGGVLADVQAPPITELKVYYDEYCANIGLSGGFSVSRSYLDQALINRAIEAGVEFSDRILAQVKPVSDHRRGVSLRVSGAGTHLVSASVVIIADGLAGTALGDDECLRTLVARGSRMGAGVVLRDAPSFYEAGTIYMVSGPLGYVGLVRLEDGSLDVAAALILGHTRDLGGPGKAAELLLAASGLPEIHGLANSTWRGTPALTRSPERLHGERLFLLGDAAGYIEPFTGEGIAWAVAGSEALTDLALAGVQNWHPDLGIAWEKRHRILIRRQQIGCRVLASVMYRPGVARLLIRLLSRSPQLSRPFVRLVTQPLPA